MNDSTIGTLMLTNMIDARCFEPATRSLQQCHHCIDLDGLETLLLAMCRSYDTVQWNVEDDVRYGRVGFVDALVRCVEERATQRFVNERTALALAFYPFSRAAFVALCCKTRLCARDVFADQTIERLPGLDGVLGEDGLLWGTCLRDMYWGRGSDEAVLEFLTQDLAPYFTPWRSTERARRHLSSLVVSAPQRSFMYTAATAARCGLLRRENVSFEIGCLLERDPSCPFDAEIADALIVGRALRLDDFMQRRLCNTGNALRVVLGPCFYAERALAAETLICVLEPLRLPPYVLLWIIDWLFGLGIQQCAFVDNVVRVYAAANRIRSERPQPNKR